MKRRAKDYYAPTKPVTPTMRAIRSAISSGSELIHDIDHRSAWARRLNDLICNYERDLGGHDCLSEAQIALVRRCSMLCLQLELLEQKFAQQNGAATERQLHQYQSCSNSLRRISESLNLNRGRVARDVTTLGDLLRDDRHRQRESRKEARP
jgi:hypothetical protein